jgi:hypothetical protein
VGILVHLAPDADRLRRVVLPQERRQALRPVKTLQALPEGAGQDLVVDPVDDVEDRL